MSNPGDSASDNSEKLEKLFQRGTGEGQYICDFDKWDYMQLSTYLFQNSCWSCEASASHEKQFAP